MKANLTHAGIQDLRSVLELMEEKGELSRVTGEVDWNLELGTLSREVYRRKGPSLLFENIKDYNTPNARCSKLATGLFATNRRISLMLGFEDEVSNRELIDYVIKKNPQTIKPRMVEDGVVHQNVLMGEDINLYDFPVPHWHHLDGGRYINTLGAIITKDPDTGETNVGIYRGMISEKDKIGVLIVNSQHWGHHWSKYKERNEPMPVACVYGWDPIMDFLAGSPIPAGVCEYDVLGAYREEPVPLVKCKTVDLEVPASAELVVEGHISTDPSAKVLEGPFGEFTGYVSDIPTLREYIQVSAITHRDDPIFRGTLEGSLPGASGENSYMSAIQRSAIAFNILKGQGIPGIKDVYINPVTNGTTVYVQIKKTYEGQPKHVSAALWGSGAAQFRYKNVIVVDEDIDPSDHSAIDWAIAYRVNPGTDDLVVFPGSFGSTLDPSTPLEDRSIADLGSGLWNRMLIDATKTFRFPTREKWGNKKFPPTVHNRPEDVELVKSRWDDYGFTNWDAKF
ncbi:UbiD family decarboxylase [Alteribacillus sp. YIM 98480]|uniref:UbiD family decarboxylase n=1 Tax=Alteribacillus sp. YIM 98480 TaxID=2606599 RepID=UPI00131CB6B3|nr:UbiD family decarboxylase [Alteribacillus sp. YIM 98480]